MIFKLSHYLLYYDQNHILIFFLYYKHRRMIVFVVSARLSFLSKVTVQPPKPQPVILELKLKQKIILTHVQIEEKEV